MSQYILDRQYISHEILTRRRFPSRTSECPAVCRSPQTLSTAALENTRHIAPETAQSHFKETQGTFHWRRISQRNAFWWLMGHPPPAEKPRAQKLRCGGCV